MHAGSDSPSSLARSKRDSAQFEVFYRTHAEELLVYLTRRTLDGHVALELTAETFAIAYRRRHQFRGESEAEAAAWLFRIAANQHRKYLRTGQAQQRAVRRLGIATPTSTDADITRIEELAGVDELRRTVARLFTDLPASQQRAVALRVLDELPYPEVARRLGITEQTARARVSRGLRGLRGALGPAHEENTA